MNSYDRIKNFCNLLRTPPKDSVPILLDLWSGDKNYCALGLWRKERMGNNLISSEPEVEKNIFADKSPILKIPKPIKILLDAFVSEIGSESRIHILNDSRVPWYIIADIVEWNYNPDEDCKKTILDKYRKGLVEWDENFYNQ